MYTPLRKRGQVIAKILNVVVVFSLLCAPLASAFAQTATDTSSSVSPDSSSTSDTTGTLSGDVATTPAATSDSSGNSDQSQSGSGNSNSEVNVPSLFNSLTSGSQSPDSGATDGSDTSDQSQSATNHTTNSSVHPDLLPPSGGGPLAPNVQNPTLFGYQSIAPQVDQTSGALTEKIPLDIPPGRNGLQPDISLEYNSQKLEDDSIVGYGWSTSIPYIERMNKTGTNNLYNDNYYYSSVSGELATTTATTSPDAYYARVDDGSFIQYTHSTSTNSWIAYDKKGTEYEYGIDSSGQQYDVNGSSNNVYLWELEKVEDTNGNYITYTYTRDQNQLYPDTITYTGNGVTAGPMTITFSLASSTIPYTTYKAAFPISTDKQVSQIEASVNGTWVRKYALTYGVGDNGFRPMLTSIQETGQDTNSNQITLPATSFSYASSSVTFVNNGANRGYQLENQAYLGIPSTDNGLADEATFEQSPGSGVKTGFINGNNIGTVPQVWAQGGAPNAPWELGTRFVDINGDGIPDLVRGYSDSTNVNELYLNTSTTTGSYNTWTEISTSTASIPFFGDSSGETGGLLGNLNGDALPDYAMASPGIGSTTSYLGNGQGWTQTSDFSPMEHMPNNLGTPQNDSRLVDINGDGLDDWMYTDGTNTYFCLNTGAQWQSGCLSSWTIASTTIWTSGGGGSVCGDRGFRLVDINGDGLPDLVRSYNGTYGGGFPAQNGCELGIANEVWLNTGSGWATSTIQLPAGGIVGAEAGGVQSFNELVDWNGDGLPDQDTSYNQASRQDLLSKITYPKGGTTQISYEMTSQDVTDNPHLPTPLLVVTKLVTNDWEGHNTEYDYSYAGGKLFLANGPIDRKFAGFSTITEDGPLADIITYYSQGDTASTSIGERSDGFAQIGHPFRQDVTSTTGTVLKRTFYELNSASLGNGRYLLTPGITLTQDFDSTGSTHKDHAAAYQYSTTTGDLFETDDYGQVNGNSDGTYTDTGSDDSVASTTFAYNSSINLSAPIDTTVSVASSTKLKETRYTYDDQSYGTVTNGNVTKEEDWISGGTYASTTKGYNSYGLVASSTDANGNETTYSYDPYNMYPTTVTNALSQATSYTYDYPTGNVAQTTDPNTFVTKNIYDAVGRLDEVDEPDISSPSTLVPKQTIAHADNAFPSYTTTTSYLTSATSSTAYKYFDGLGRTIQTRTQAQGNNTYAAKDSVYGSNGLLSKDSLPYFASSTSYTTATSTTSLFTNYSYDPLERTTVILNSVGTTTDSYGAWQVSKTDPDGNTTGYNYDAFENMVNVIGPIATTTATTSYAYDLLNNLTKITDASNNVRNFTYDGLSRVLTAQDLHASSTATFGTTTYSYDSANNLISKLDPNGHTTTYTYDALSRPATESDTNGAEVTNTYDSCTDGIGYLCVASTTASRIANAYNAVGLVASTTNTVGGTGYETIYSYDRQGNVTEIVYPGGNDLKYAQDATGKIQGITNKVPGGSTYASVLSNVQYAPTDQPNVRAYANGFTSFYTYDPTIQYRLSNLLTSTSTTATSTVTQNISYVYDPVGNITHIADTSYTDAAELSDLSYDSLNRLSAASSSPYGPSPAAQYLIVGGGGGGAPGGGTTYGGGGGGAGGMLTGSAAVTAQAYTVTVGAGGSASANGNSSSVFGFTATGGGSGSNPATGVGAGNGGSGGGGSGNANPNGGSGTPGQGNDGGYNGNGNGASGGGGASEVGHQTFGGNGGADGGAGTASSISGSSVTYAGGGGGGGGGNSGGGNGGSGGGGAGGVGGGGTGTNGTAHTGGGGGGGGRPSAAGGSGGSGIDIISAPIGLITASSTGTHTTSGGNDIWTFTSNGTFSVTALGARVPPASAAYQRSYTYDALGNITGVTYNGSTTSYAYAGTNYANPDAATQMANGIATSTLTYDHNGNLTSTETTTYAWDWRNRLTQSVNGNATTTYAYDYQNNRVSQRIASSTGSTTVTTTIYPNRYYSITTTTVGATSTATSTDYLYEGDTLVATVDQAFINGIATGTPATHYYYPDHLNSTNDVTDASGNLLQTLDYYPYGSTRINTEVGGTNANRQYIGQFTDPTNLSYLNARYYDSSRGQFLSQDPVFLGNPKGQDLVNPQSLNSYSYAVGNPITKKDPQGRYVEISGSVVAPGQAWSAGLRVDRNGIDYFLSSGVGVGLAAGFELMWAPGIALPHSRQVSVTANGTVADGVGGRVSDNIWTYDPTTKKTVDKGEPVLGLVFGAGEGGSVQVDGSAPVPYLVWNKPIAPGTSGNTDNIPATISSYNSYGSSAQYVVKNNATYVRTPSGGLSPTSLPATVNNSGVTYFRNSSGLLSAAPNQ